jgi:hypothetical protein
VLYDAKSIHARHHKVQHEGSELADVQHGDTAVAAEALYWRDVARYSQSHDTAPLHSVVRELQQRFPDSDWAVKASVWAG